jgi:hypothetical protein
MKNLITSWNDFRQGSNTLPANFVACPSHQHTLLSPTVPANEQMVQTKDNIMGWGGGLRGDVELGGWVRQNTAKQSHR